jgi:hypothetical protein
MCVQMEGEPGPGRLVVRGSGAMPRVLESSHPYENSKDELRLLEIPGASSIRITFDTATRTERGYGRQPCRSVAHRMREHTCAENDTELFVKTCAHEHTPSVVAP